MSSHHEETHDNHHAASHARWNWNWWYVGSVVAFLTIVYLLLSQSGCSFNKPSTYYEGISDAHAVESAEHGHGGAVEEHATTTEEKESIKVQLPNGTELDAYKGGIEDQLVHFLSSDYKALGADSLKKIWFDFDNLNFETASASITASSKVQLENIAAILKAFPATKIKIGGYTDKTGDEAKNVKLSQDRATAVLDGLKTLGVGAQVTDAEGYGSSVAKYPATAPENDRITDRRVSVSVRD